MNHADEITIKAKALQVIKDVRTFYTNDPHLWIKGTYSRSLFNSNGELHKTARCMEGALCYETYVRNKNDPNEYKFLTTAFAWINSEILDGDGCIVEWNDADTTTYHDVISLLDRVIEKHDKETS